jgi:2-haloacid dehalogenase
MPISTIVFDAYGTLFDVAGAARLAATEPDQSALAAVWPRLAEDWRRKQLEYTWLRSIMGCHADFASVTADALDWAMEAAGLADAGLRARLLALYDHLPAYPDVPDALDRLAARGATLAILSNGTPAMLEAATRAAGIGTRFAALLSVEEVGVYKPHTSVYGMVARHLGARADEVLFVSSNGWDVAGAAGFGFTTVWINRNQLPIDRLPFAPHHIAPDLSTLPHIAGLP